MLTKKIKEWIVIPLLTAVVIFMGCTIAGLGFSYGYLLNKDKVFFICVKD